MAIGLKAFGACLGNYYAIEVIARLPPTAHIQAIPFPLSPTPDPLYDPLEKIFYRKGPLIA
jgi:hypothetical protein